MFLDEELEEILSEDLSANAEAERIKQAWMKRFPNAPCSKSNFANALKQIDSSWSLFCKRHGEYKVEAFREFVRPKQSFGSRSTETLNDINKQYLNWW